MFPRTHLMNHDEILMIFRIHSLYIDTIVNHQLTIVGQHFPDYPLIHIPHHAKP